MVENLKEGFNKIRIVINNTKKKTLKQIAKKIINNNDDLYQYVKYNHWYDYMLDLIDTKCFKKHI